MSLAKMNTSIKIILVVTSGIILLMLLQIHLLSRKKEIAELVQELEDGTKVPVPYWKNCKDRPQYSLATDKDCVPCLEYSKKKIHLVTNIFPMFIAQRRAKIWPKGPEWGFTEEWDKINKEEVFKQRDRELLDVLQKNLNNNLVAAIHIIFKNDRVVDYIMSQKFRFICKVVFHKVNRDPTYEDTMLYVGKYLRHRLVVFANQDIYLGQGWDQLDFERIRKEKIMYALTRHGKKERFCTMPDDCSRVAKYRGSHDAFAFVLIHMPKENDLIKLRHKNDKMGIENVFIDYFSKKLHYSVINPCFVLYTYHVHCANVHNKKRPRINNRYDNTGRARFIDQLYTT